MNWSELFNACVILVSGLLSITCFRIAYEVWKTPKAEYARNQKRAIEEREMWKWLRGRHK